MTFQKIKKYKFRQSLYRGLHRLASKFHFHPLYFFRKYLFGYAIKEVNGVRMYLDLKNDEGISKFLMIHGKREPVTVDYLIGSKILKAGDVALDIGANIGYYALLESKMVGRTGIVYAVEPIRNNLTNLKKNISLNNVSNIRTYNLAMGDADREKIEIFMRSKGNLSSLTSLPLDYSEVVSVEEVSMSTVDSFVKREMDVPPKFIRMDVEGYEANILEGMKNTLTSKPHLQIEFHPTILSEDQKNGICELLRGNSYSKAVITVNPKPGLSPLLRWLNKKIGENYHESGESSEGDIDHLRKLLSRSPRIFNAFIS
jgi:FkbM family methyltransferase